MKIAEIKCPHCGEKIRVRQVDEHTVSPENERKIWDAADEMFKAMDAGFRKIFNPALWR